MPGIEKICYRAVGNNVRLSVGEGGVQYVLLPAPMDHDHCFMEAGYEYFADSDDAWDEDYKGLLRLALDELGGEEEARLAEAFAEFHGKAIGIEEALWVATLEDNYPPADVLFGDPVNARMTTGDSHEAVWLAFAKGRAAVFERLLARVRERWEVEEIGIELDGLVPGHHAT